MKHQVLQVLTLVVLTKADSGQIYQHTFFGESTGKTSTNFGTESGSFDGHHSGKSQSFETAPIDHSQAFAPAPQSFNQSPRFGKAETFVGQSSAQRKDTFFGAPSNHQRGSNTFENGNPKSRNFFSSSRIGKQNSLDLNPQVHRQIHHVETEHVNVQPNGEFRNLGTIHNFDQLHEDVQRQVNPAFRVGGQSEFVQLERIIPQQQFGHDQNQNFEHSTFGSSQGLIQQEQRGFEIQNQERIIQEQNLERQHQKQIDFQHSSFGSSHSQFKPVQNAFVHHEIPSQKKFGFGNENTQHLIQNEIPNVQQIKVNDNSFRAGKSSSIAGSSGNVKHESAIFGASSSSNQHHSGQFKSGVRHFEEQSGQRFQSHDIPLQNSAPIQDIHQTSNTHNFEEQRFQSHDASIQHSRPLQEFHEVSNSQTVQQEIESFRPSFLERPSFFNQNNIPNNKEFKESDKSFRSGKSETSDISSVDQRRPSTFFGNTEFNGRTFGQGQRKFENSDRRGKSNIFGLNRNIEEHDSDTFQKASGIIEQSSILPAIVQPNKNSQISQIEQNRAGKAESFESPSSIHQPHTFFGTTSQHKEIFASRDRTFGDAEALRSGKSDSLDTSLVNERQQSSTFGAQHLRQQSSNQGQRSFGNLKSGNFVGPSRIGKANTLRSSNGQNQVTVVQESTPIEGQFQQKQQGIVHPFQSPTFNRQVIRNHPSTSRSQNEHIQGQERTIPEGQFQQSQEGIVHPFQSPKFTQRTNTNSPVKIQSLPNIRPEVRESLGQTQRFTSKIEHNPVIVQDSVRTNQDIRVSSQGSQAFQRVPQTSQGRVQDNFRVVPVVRTSNQRFPERLQTTQAASQGNVRRTQSVRQPSQGTVRANQSHQRFQQPSLTTSQQSSRPIQETRIVSNNQPAPQAAASFRPAFLQQPSFFAQQQRQQLETNEV